MEKYKLEKDIKVFCVTAASFPECVKEAFDTLQKMLLTTDRTFYGLSHGNKDGTITYKAAVEEVFEGEAETYGCETFVIKKGSYLAESIWDWKKNIQSIGTTFQTLLANDRFDGISPCIEWYKSNDELICMVKEKSEVAAT